MCGGGGMAYAVGLGPTRARFPFAGGLTCSVQVRIPLRRIQILLRFYYDALYSISKVAEDPPDQLLGVVVFVPWFGWNRIPGAPDWLAILGLQGWFQKLHPLDSRIVAPLHDVLLFVALFQDRIGQDYSALI